jgi:TrmH family RNA methyltransferase
MINSTSNNQMKWVAGLIKKSKARNEAGVFVVEGFKMFQEIPVDRIKQVYLSESFYELHKEDGRLKGIACELVSDRVFKSISDTQTPQGILCIVEQFQYNLEKMLTKSNPLLLLLENIQDPGNLGTILRTGEGAGVDGVIISKNSVDIYNPKTIRSTMGSIYRLPFLYIEDLASIFPTLKQHSIKTYAAHLENSEYYDTKSYMEGTAFLIGNEGNGLTEELASAADEYLKIPMHGKVESLNAAVAASILMYEACRQRR